MVKFQQILGTVTIAIIIYPSIGINSVEATTFLGPSEYLCFDSSKSGIDFSGDCSGKDSPFAEESFNYFYLEDFEDGLVNTLGVSASSGVVTSPGSSDSIDADDGTINGSGLPGRSYFGPLGGSVGFTFTFDAITLGSLPTHAGIVWTDGATFNDVTFEAFDADNNSLGTIFAPNIGDGDINGGTAEDRFFGVTNTGGISAIRIVSPAALGASGAGIEVDHLQYGLITTPEPSTILSLLTIGGVALGAYKKK